MVWFDCMINHVRLEIFAWASGSWHLGPHLQTICSFTDTVATGHQHYHQLWGVLPILADEQVFTKESSSPSELSGEHPEPDRGAEGVGLGETNSMNVIVQHNIIWSSYNCFTQCHMTICQVMWTEMKFVMSYYMRNSDKKPLNMMKHDTHFLTLSYDF